MLQNLARFDDVGAGGGGPEFELQNLRSVMRATTQLPSLVIEAKFSNVLDRVLDETTIAALTDPSAVPEGNSDERCRRRKKALAPYLGRRLICVLISLPGVLYTVEIDPSLEKVIHWEFLATQAINNCNT